MDELKILKGNKKNLSNELDNNTIYVAFSDDKNEYSSIIINGREWVSKEYVDLKIGEIENLLKEL